MIKSNYVLIFNVITNIVFSLILPLILAFCGYIIKASVTNEEANHYVKKEHENFKEDLKEIKKTLIMLENRISKILFFLKNNNTLNKTISLKGESKNE